MGVIRLERKGTEVADPADATEAEPGRLGEVLDVAARLFHEKGYRGTSLVEIGAALGMNKASLYYYVRSKEELARRLILRASRRLRDIARSPEIEALPPEQALERLVREHCAVLLEFPHEMGLLIQQRKYVAPETLREIGERERIYVAHVRAVIARGIESGVFRQADVGVATSLALDAINGLLRWWKPDGRLPREAVLDAVWTFIQGGLSAPAPRRKRHAS
ncbi:MAG TPA: TetR/AcrR family transcriptional regulator [Ramlibacter sp.]|nr:TetR/AcrR family transcriptional regulator [Ramlibacter sp.]